MVTPANMWQPTGPRLPIGQYRVTALITGDAVGPETLSWIVADRLHSMAGGAISGRVELIETVTPDASGPAGWIAALERRVGPTTSYAEAIQPATPDRLETLRRVGLIPENAYPDPPCGTPTGHASNLCLLSPSHPGDHDDDPPQEGREKGIVQDVLNAVLDRVNRLGASGMHGQIMRSEVNDLIHEIADHYGVVP
jgi:hypothetical protein